MRALLVVDIQNDFLPGGALGVRYGDEVIPVINRIMPLFGLVVASQDWHPQGHKSFASAHGKQVGEKIILNGIEQVLWPDHCVQGTQGADLAPALDRSSIERVFPKGTSLDIDSYSAFFDNGHKKATGLMDFLKTKRVSEIYIAGLATDYCVLYSALDAVKLGLGVTVVMDGCRGIDLNPGDIDKAVREMIKAGVRITEDLADDGKEWVKEL